MAKFKNKTVWITGASYGLGRSLAVLMAQKGWHVAASARSAEDLLSLSQEAQKWRGHIKAFPCDITDPDNVRFTVQDMVEKIGSIEIAVLNAGTHLPVHAKSFRAADFQTLIDINLMGTIHCVDQVLEPMKEQGHGQVALVSSVAGYRGLPTSSAYGMTKAGLINMAEALKPELDLLNIKMQVICPGFVRTPLTDKNEFDMPFLMEPEDAAKAFYRGLVSGRFEVVFPWQMGIIFKFIRLLPAPLAFAITRRMIPNEGDA